MKCPSCGAEVGTNKVCEYCGTTITAEMQREQEQVNKEGCPKCGSTNIEFKRENQGEIRGKNSKKIVHTTVGFCKDCGHTWYPQGETPKKSKTWLWVLGWIFIFPVPLTILMLRKKDMKPALKYGIIAAGWIVYLLIGLSGNSNNTSSESASEATSIEASTPSDGIPPKTSSTEITKTEDKTDDSTDNGAEKRFFDSAEIIDLKNGFGTSTVGSISVLHAKEKDCSEDALTEWYFDYVLSHPECNYHIIVFDDSSRGVYSSGNGSINYNIGLTKESDGTYSFGEDDGSTYYVVDADKKTISAYMTMADSNTTNKVKSSIEELIPDEYKNGRLYSVDVAGPEGELDCNITLVGESLKKADYQALALEYATKVYEADLGIGYFCIAFQSDDATLEAISSVDLAEEEPSNISTKEF